MTRAFYAMRSSTCQSLANGLHGQAAARAGRRASFCLPALSGESPCLGKVDPKLFPMVLETESVIERVHSRAHMATRGD